MRKTAAEGILWLVWALLFLGACQEQGISGSEFGEEPADPLIRAKVEPEEATIGDLVTYTVTLSRSPEISVTLPETMAPVPGLSLLDQGKTGPDSRGARIIETRWYKFRADDVATAVFPEVTAFYGDQEEPNEIRTEEVVLNVKSVLPQEMQEIFDIKPLERPGLDKRVVFYAAAGLVLTALAVLALWLKTRQRPGDAEAVSPLLPPREEAEQALRRLEAMDLIAKGEIKEYYFIFSEIFRRYLERRFRVPAIERTSEEILQHLPSVNIRSEVKGRIRASLLSADLVKFAGAVPRRQEIDMETRAFREFLEITSRQEETADEEAVHVAL